jgi:hypothetical protein
MQIHDLTKSQCDMLATMWTLDSSEELDAFRSLLPIESQQQIDTLIELVRLQSVDDQIDNTDDFAIADELFCRLM